MDPARDALLLTHAFATCFMTGLVWFVQLVHYPLMASAARDDDPTHYPRFQTQHMRRTTWIVAPVMLTELSCALAIPALGLAPNTLAIPALLLLALVWISTFALQVPAHSALERAFDPRAHTRLVALNWPRTLLWTARSALALLMLRA
jgi:hypothetical protein